MRKLKEIQQIQDYTTIHSASLFRAILANFWNGLDRGHIDIKIARNYFLTLTDRLLAIAPTASFDSLFIDIAYSKAEQLFGDLITGSYHQRTGALDCDRKARAFTIKDFGTVRHWLTSRAASTRSPHPFTAKKCSDEFNAGKARKPGASISQPDQLIWYTPLSSEIEDHLRDVSKADADEIARKRNATILRDAFGLYQKGPGTHLYGVITRKTVEQLCQAYPCPTAPTLFDACAYERFRHWPLLGESLTENIGRTYNLCPDPRSPGMHCRGVPEFVAGSMRIDEIDRLIYLGKVRGGSSTTTVIKEHENYAQDVAIGRDSFELIDTIADYLHL